MERTTSDGALGQDPVGATSPAPAGEAQVPVGLNILPPADFRRDARFVANRMAIPRRPPELPIVPTILPTPTPAQSAPAETRSYIAGAMPKWDRLMAEGLRPDLERMANLGNDLLAWRVTEMSNRLAEREDLISRPEATAGLRVLSLQALLFEHMKILQSAAAEGNA